MGPPGVIWPNHRNLRQLHSTSSAPTGSKPPPPSTTPPPHQGGEDDLLDDVLFDFDKSTIKPEAAQILDPLVAFMNEKKGSKVGLAGFTDSIGTEA